MKWRFIDQTETFPALAFAIGGILPTGSEDKNLGEVDHWGARFSALASSEARLLDDSFLGLNKEQAGYDNTVRFIGTVSYTF